MPRKVILVTDGDEYARKAVEHVASEIGGRCISLSSGNPSPLCGPDIVELIKEAEKEPVLVMFDDSGLIGEGPGEEALKYVASHPEIEVLGIVAVASNTHKAEWTRVDVCIDRYGELTPNGVDKFGVQEMEIGRIYGDTVYCLDSLDVPVVIGIGDIGKMARRDHYALGAPITKKAIEVILERSGYHDQQK